MPRQFGYLDTFTGAGGRYQFMEAMGWSSTPGIVFPNQGNETIDTEPNSHASGFVHQHDIYGGILNGMCRSAGNARHRSATRRCRSSSGFHEDQAFELTWNGGMGAKDGWQEASSENLPSLRRCYCSINVVQHGPSTRLVCCQSEHDAVL
jgi:hypothetical protein